MGRSIISEEQATASVYLVLLSGILAQGINLTAGADSYIANAIALIMAMPLYLMLSRIIKLFPGKDLFEILESLLGKFIGKVITVITVIYAAIFAANALRGNTYYIYIESIPETPLYILYIAILAVIAIAVYCGVEVRARLSHALAWIYTVFALSILALSLNAVHVEYLKPVMYNGFAPVLSGAFELLVFPYGGVIILLSSFAHLKPGSHVMKIFAKGAFYAFIIIGLVMIRNLLVLGPESLKLFIYPSHQAISLISIGNFLERMEVLPAIINFFCDLTKIAACVYFAARGLQRLFNVPNYKTFIAPIFFLILNYSLLAKDYVSDVIQWRQAYIYFAVPFEILLPLILFIIAEVKHRISKALSSMAQSAS